MPGDGGGPLLEVEDLVVTYPLRRGLLRRAFAEVQAVSEVSFSIDKGETLGIVGESGCGKSTIARTIVGLERPKAGHVRFEGRDITGVSGSERKQLKRDVQIVFQDPYSSMNPHMTVRELVVEPWEIHRGVLPREKWPDRVMQLLEMVGMGPEHANRYPHQLSGGQRQRVCIARALALEPRLLICDEPVSALDVSIQAQILNLLEDLQRRIGLTYMFISHDLSVVRHICHRVAIMYLGKIVELGDEDSIYGSPTHPYTQSLLSAVPVPEPWLKERKHIVLEGDIASPVDPPSGCRFRTRCWKADDRCAREEPLLEHRDFSHPSACHYAEAERDVLPAG